MARRPGLSFIKSEVPTEVWARFEKLSRGLGYTRAQIVRMLVETWCDELESGSIVVGVEKVETSLSQVRDCSDIRYPITP